jgi:osmotically-inducible protein OsmY
MKNAICMLAAAASLALMIRTNPAAGQTANSPSAPALTYESHSVKEEHAHSDALHHYASPADQAKDALLITEVKAALANDDATAGHPIAVDCDHGTIVLTGVVVSEADAQHLVAVSSRQPGVMDVKNRLQWQASNSNE